MDRLWCDKYRPKTLELLDYHKNISTILRKLSFCVDFPHLLFYGPNGAGKKTRVMAFLSETFGNGVFKLKQDYWEFKLSAANSTKVECTVLTSNYHIDITPSECESYDHVVLQKLIKEVVTNFQLDNNKAQKGVKFIVINDCDKLSRAAQAALSRTMEKYSDICKLILVCENLGKIIHSLRGKCSMIRVPAPSNTDIENVLKLILKKENVLFPEQMLGRIAETSERNMRKAILQFQTLRLKISNTTTGVIDFSAPEWRQGIRNIFEHLIREQSLKTLKLIRERVYDLMVNCVPGDLIIKYLLLDLLGKVNGDVACLLIEYAACYENKLRKGSKVIFHIEGFIAKVMVIYNQYITAIGNRTVTMTESST